MRSEDRDIDPARRRFMLRALAGLGASWLPARLVEAAEALAGRSIYLLSGFVTVNGRQATPEMAIRATDLIETGSDGKIVFRVEGDAFILRRNSRLQLLPTPARDNALVQTLRLVTGGLLSVFARRAHRLETPNATIGIRGTGVYCEIEPDRDYVCTCYGVTDISATDDPSARETVDAGHHESRYVLAAGLSKGRRIVQASFKNHTDEELALIESLVGREPAFRGARPAYERPRRRQY